MAVIKKQYELEGLHCGDCAVKIEREVSGLDGVSAANVDFASRLLTVEFSEQAIPENIAEQARKIAKRHDSDITLKEKELPQTGKRVLYLLGLDCADCAIKIETAVSRMDGVKSANVDFATERLTIEIDDKENAPAITRLAAQTIREMEPDVEISYSERLRKKRRRMRGKSACARPV